VNGESVKVHRFRRAVFSIARAHILGTNRDVDTTGDAGENAPLRWRRRPMICGAMHAGRSPIFAAPCATLRRRSDESAGIAGRYRGFAVSAHYGTTQGVTEIVLAANKALAGQIFLDAGQVVELPEISTTATRRPYSYGAD
jgi:hypothetical protein